MAQREWVEKDFYKELGVASDAGDRATSRGRTASWPRGAPSPTRNPGNTAAEEPVQSACPEAMDVLSGSGQAQGVRRDPTALRGRRLRPRCVSVVGRWR